MEHKVDELKNSSQLFPNIQLLYDYFVDNFGLHKHNFYAYKN